MFISGIVDSDEAVCAPAKNQKQSECHLVGDAVERENLEHDMQVELLQRELHLKSRSNIERGFKEIKMKSWIFCSTNGSFFQSTTKNDNSESKITRWYPASGTGSVVRTLKPEETEPKFRSLNACDVNPKNNILYCSLAITNKGTFLVAIDDEKIGFVDKVWEARYTGTFDYDDNYYVYAGKDDNGRLGVITEVSKKPVYDSWLGLQQYNNDIKQGERFLGVKDYVKADGKLVHEFHLGADLAFFEADLRGKGQEKYLASLTFSSKTTKVSAMKLLVIPCARGNESCKATYPPNPSELAFLSETDPELHELEIISDLPETEEFDARVWGTAFATKNANWETPPTDIYFSADDGLGLYSANGNSYDWSAKTVAMNRLGNAVVTSWNDGISCVDNRTEPFKKTCTKGAMFRSTTKDRNPDPALAKSAILVLDPKSGVQIDSWDLPNIEVLNACAINPKDNQIYCVVHPRAQCAGDDKIARIDSKGNVGYISNFKGGAVAGTFDEEGNYWVFGTNDGLFRYEHAHKFTATAECQVFNNNQPENTINKTFGEEMRKTPIGDKQGIGYSGKQIGSDMEILVLNGRHYIVSMPGTEGSSAEFQNRVTLIDITDVMKGTATTPKDPIILFDTKQTLPSPLDEAEKGQTQDSMTWGSAWRIPPLAPECKGSTEGEGCEVSYVFASDDGQGYWKLKPDTINMAAKTVEFEKWGTPPSPIEWNNGFACYTESPLDLNFTAREKKNFKL